MTKKIIRTDLVIVYRLPGCKRGSVACSTNTMTYKNIPQSLDRVCKLGDNLRVDCVSPTFETQSEAVMLIRYIRHMIVTPFGYLHVLFYDIPQLLQVYSLDSITFVSNRTLSHADRIVDSFLCCVSCGLE